MPCHTLWITHSQFAADYSKKSQQLVSKHNLHLQTFIFMGFYLKIYSYLSNNFSLDFLYLSQY